jgi:hypothetical protein
MVYSAQRFNGFLEEQRGTKKSLDIILYKEMSMHDVLNRACAICTT